MREMLKRGLGVHHAGTASLALFWACCRAPRRSCTWHACPGRMGRPGWCPERGWDEQKGQSRLVPSLIVAPLRPLPPAGLLPIVKEIVEMLFCRGVIKARASWCSCMGAVTRARLAHL